MMDVRKTLIKYHFSEEAIKAATSGGIKIFYPPQEQAIKAGALDGKNLLLAIPTAAGKTFVAELAMIKSVLQSSGRCLYIAPLKALASEKYHDFQKKYESLGIKIGIATGDLDSPSRNLNRYQILIATAEKVDALLRSRAKWLIDDLSVVVLDEIHFINDGSRGPTLEILTARIKQLNPNIQILALSATVSNAKEMAAWLNAQCVESQWRPVPLREGVYFNEEIKFDGFGTKSIKEEPPDDLSKLVIDTLRSKGQVLVFVNSRRSAQASSLLLCHEVGPLLNPQEKKKLLALSAEMLHGSGETTKICHKLANVIKNGVAFHHAGLRPGQRKLIEDSFRENLIRVICSTPTLAAGVNLPARRAILRDSKRYESGVGAAYIPTSEYKQCAGRAGRPGYDDFGEAVMIAKSFSEARFFFEHYIEAKPEPVISKLGNESALRIHVLAALASGHVHDIDSMFEFITHTFLAHQKLTPNLIEIISNIFTFLERHGLIEKSGFRYFATSFGQCVSRLYIDPITGIMLHHGLAKAHHGAPFTTTGLLHLISCCPDMERLRSITKSDYDELQTFAASCEDDFIVNQNDVPELEDVFFQLSVLKTTWMLTNWIEEEKEESLCDRFNIGPGDIHRHVEAAQWILYATSVIAELFKFKRLTFIADDLKTRVHYGIHEELLELVLLKGVGRIRARNLFEKGFKRLTDFRLTPIDDLASVPQIGKALAKDILEQIQKFLKK
jgi:helicase